jgi:hypothetical protein
VPFLCLQRFGIALCTIFRAIALWPRRLFDETNETAELDPTGGRHRLLAATVDNQEERHESSS